MVDIISTGRLNTEAFRIFIMFPPQEKSTSLPHFKKFDLECIPSILYFYSVPGKKSAS